jgi:hypothetical protein
MVIYIYIITYIYIYGLFIYTIWLFNIGIPNHHYIYIPYGLLSRE